MAEIVNHLKSIVNRLLKIFGLQFKNKTLYIEDFYRFFRFTKFAFMIHYCEFITLIEQKMKSIEMDMTQGSLFKKIFIFSVPLVITNVLQILFNMTDTAVVGRFAGYLPLGSVGSTGQMVFFCSGILTGLGGGVNVLAAICVGQKNYKDFEVTVRASAVACFCIGILLLVAGIFSATGILKLLNTKPELLHDAVVYFKIYMLCMPAMAMYNFGNAILSAQGDTRSPLLYLIAAGIVNVFLDLLLVIVFKLSVIGVGVATEIAQYISCILTLRKIYKVLSKNNFDFKYRQISSYKILQIIKIGVPAGLQNAIFAIANLFIVAAVNSFDAAMVAGNAATMNGDNLVFNIMSAFYTAGATFIGQNLGAHKKKRILNSYFISMGYATIAGFVLGGVLFVFGQEFLSLFTKDQTVVDYAMQKFKIMTFSFGISAFMDGTIAASRGLRKTLVPSVMVFIGSCVLRVIWVFTIFAHFRTVESLFLLYPFSWAVTAVFEIVYFAIIYKKETADM